MGEEIKKNKGKKRISDLDEKIYLMCYMKPHHKDEIAELLYGEYKGTSGSTITQQKGIISEMEKEGLLVTWTLSELEPDKKNNKRYWLKTDESDTAYPVIITDGRQRKRTYCFSTIKPLIEGIESEVHLKEKERIIIKEILKSNDFRHLVNWQFHKVIKDYKDNINPINYIIFTLAEAAGNLWSLLLLNPGITVKLMFKHWDKVTNNLIRRGANYPNIKIILDSVNIKQNELIKIKKQVKIFLKADKDLLEKLMQLSPFAKRNLIYMALGSSMYKNIFK